MSALIVALLIAIAALIGLLVAVVVGFMAKLHGAPAHEIITRAGVAFGGTTLFILTVMGAAKVL